ncbi:hypothetical protein jhhlp_006514 [Lomentospora prolificans]|uniref:Endopolyphosphatase n=1 Tax=Lomentospora prolificans TaxID=41688 RepID=A0A2N3N653_9PEZI|nr:hypothetical protein jhhlp_006514 [Lomentospora prolificans]
MANSRLILAALYASLGLIPGATGSSSTYEGLQRVLDAGADRSDASHLGAPGQKSLRGRFLHITDFHPDEYYKPYTNTDMVCHRRKGNAGYYGTELSSCDSPRSLANATLDWVAANLRDEIDFVIWTGDSARHDSDEQIPRTAAEVLRSNQYLADKMFSTFADENNPERLAVPVIPTIGNNDFIPHNVLLPGPNRWLQHYSEIWRPFIPEEQRHAFEFGGWFWVEVIPNRLAVFSLNTMYFFDRNAAIDNCVNPVEPGFKQLEWLRIQLQLLRSRGMKAILTGHVPPAKTDSKELWDESCWQKYNLWMRQFRDVVTGTVYGHMNIDHFVLHDTRQINIDFIGGNSETSSERIGLDFGDEEEPEEDDDDGGNDEEWEEEEEVDEMERHDELKKKKRSSVSVKGSKTKYLVELRELWSKLPPVKVLCEDHNDDVQEVEDAALRRKKGKKKRRKRKKKLLKKLGGKWAERYHVSLISPSVVPNFFPTLRVVEYNITGLEDLPTWLPPNDSKPPTVRQYSDDDAELQELDEEIERAKTIKATNGPKGKGKGKKKKKKKGKKPKDPSLVVPEGPDKTAEPGPAYSMQPLTFTGYTQYFSNLTDINNISPERDPKDKNKPAAKEFNFEVEYSTFNDMVFKLPDLTVRNYVRLAFRMGLAAADRRSTKEIEVDEEGDDDDNDEEEGVDGPEEADDDEEADEEDESPPVECETVGGSSLKKHKERRRRASERAWRRFVKYAFVSTGLEEEEAAMFDDDEE